jgi:phosphoethanolamine N-methyltransferase
MASAQESRDALIAAGFTDVEVRDRRDWYRGLAQRELDLLSGEYFALLVSRLGEQRARHFVANWRQLVLVLERGELCPAHLRARRPADGAGG